MGVSARVMTKTPTFYLDFSLAQGASHSQPLPPDWNAFLYTLSGSLAIGAPSVRVSTPSPPLLLTPPKAEPHHTVVLTQGDSVTVTAVDGPARFVLLAGQPLGEAVVQHGPFVLTSREGIVAAMGDYSRGLNGFERAKSWESEIATRGGLWLRDQLASAI